MKLSKDTNDILYNLVTSCDQPRGDVLHTDSPEADCVVLDCLNPVTVKETTEIKDDDSGQKSVRRKSNEKDIYPRKKCKGGEDLPRRSGLRSQAVRLSESSVEEIPVIYPLSGQGRHRKRIENILKDEVLCENVQTSIIEKVKTENTVPTQKKTVRVNVIEGLQKFPNNKKLPKLKKHGDKYTLNLLEYFNNNKVSFPKRKRTPKLERWAYYRILENPITKERRVEARKTGFSRDRCTIKCPPNCKQSCIVTKPKNKKVVCADATTSPLHSPDLFEDLKFIDHGSTINTGQLHSLLTGGTPDSGYGSTPVDSKTISNEYDFPNCSWSLNRNTVVVPRNSTPLNMVVDINPNLLNGEVLPSRQINPHLSGRANACEPQEDSGLDLSIILEQLIGSDRNTFLPPEENFAGQTLPNVIKIDDDSAKSAQFCSSIFDNVYTAPENKLLNPGIDDSPFLFPQVTQSLNTKQMTEKCCSHCRASLSKSIEEIKIDLKTESGINQLQENLSSGSSFLQYKSQTTVSNPTLPSNPYHSEVNATVGNSQVSVSTVPNFLDSPKALSKVCQVDFNSILRSTNDASSTSTQTLSKSNHLTVSDPTLPCNTHHSEVNASVGNSQVSVSTVPNFLDSYLLHPKALSKECQVDFDSISRSTNDASSAQTGITANVCNSQVSLSTVPNFIDSYFLHPKAFSKECQVDFNSILRSTNDTSSTSTSLAQTGIPDTPSQLLSTGTNLFEQITGERTMASASAANALASNLVTVTNSNCDTTANMFHLQRNIKLPSIVTENVSVPLLYTTSANSVNLPLTEKDLRTNNSVYSDTTTNEFHLQRNIKPLSTVTENVSVPLLYDSSRLITTSANSVDLPFTKKDQNNSVNGTSPKLESTQPNCHEPMGIANIKQKFNALPVISPTNHSFYSSPNKMVSNSTSSMKSEAVEKNVCNICRVSTKNTNRPSVLIQNETSIQLESSNVSNVLISTLGMISTGSLSNQMTEPLNCLNSKSSGYPSGISKDVSPTEITCSYSFAKIPASVDTIDCKHFLQRSTGKVHSLRSALSCPIVNRDSADEVKNSFNSCIADTRAHELPKCQIEKVNSQQFFSTAVTSSQSNNSDLALNVGLKDANLDCAIDLSCRSRI